MSLIKTALISVFAIVFCFPASEAQTKKIKRPRNAVGISSVDTFVRESFDLYDKVYTYDGYAEAGTPLDDDDIDVLEDALTEVSALAETAPDIIGDLDGKGALKQAKATLQMNRAKKALKYSIKTIKDLLANKQDTDEDSSENEDDADYDSQSDNNESSGNDPMEEINSVEEPSNISDNLEVLGKFDFVPGDEVLFFDDFAKDFVGDFPSKWNTNASGEVVKINNEKWFELTSGYRVFFIPDFKDLPEDYTIEFDILTKGIDKSTTSGAKLFVYLSDSDEFTEGKNHVSAAIPFGQYSAFKIDVRNFFNGKQGKINVNLNADVRKAVLNQPHIAISVTKKRFRLWVNEVKYADIPRLIEVENVLEYVKLHTYGLQDGKDRVFIKNIKIAKGGQDLRRKLISEGKISTNGILFDSGSANIKNQSYGIIRQISQVLNQDDNIKLKIVGHTDSDGNDDSNLELSKSRAAAVKTALVEIYKIDSSRLETDGKGEANPVGDNATSKGKAENRRVEFILQ
ncbi:MAG: OmpA family protein [Bacteroidota bacterium]